MWNKPYSGCVLTIIVIVLTIGTCKTCRYFERLNYQKKIELQIVGTYRFLEREYPPQTPPAYHISGFEDLRLEMLPNRTFKFSRQSPFIYSTVGYWIPSTEPIDDASKMFFRELGNSQGFIFNVYAPGGYLDTVLTIKDITPKQGMKSQYLLTFVKEK